MFSPLLGVVVRGRDRHELDARRAVHVGQLEADVARCRSRFQLVEDVAEIGRIVSGHGTSSRSVVEGVPRDHAVDPRLEAVDGERSGSRTARGTRRGVRAPPALGEVRWTSPSSSSESTRCHLERRMACRVQSVPSSSFEARARRCAGLRLVAQRLHLLAEPEEVEAGVEDAGQRPIGGRESWRRRLHVLRLGAPDELGEAVEPRDHLGGRAGESRAVAASRRRAPCSRRTACSSRSRTPAVGLLRRRAAGRGWAGAGPRRHAAGPPRRGVTPGARPPRGPGQRHDRAGRHCQRGAGGVGALHVLARDDAAGVDGGRGARRGVACAVAPPAAAGGPLPSRSASALATRSAMRAVRSSATVRPPASGRPIEPDLRGSRGPRSCSTSSPSVTFANTLTCPNGSVSP